MAEPQAGERNGPESQAGTLVETVRVDGAAAEATLSGGELAWRPAGGGGRRKLELESEVLGLRVEGRALRVATFARGDEAGTGRSSPSLSLLGCGGSLPPEGPIVPPEVVSSSLRLACYSSETVVPSTVLGPLHEKFTIPDPLSQSVHHDLPSSNSKSSSSLCTPSPIPPFLASSSLITTYLSLNQHEIVPAELVDCIARLK